jgi:HAD superfamily hydrolase (TIGR01509 family)
MRALIFDCDGVLADTERHGHRVAFNQAFEELGVPVAWDEDTYGEMLAVGGGKERIAAALTPAFASRHDLPADAAGLAELVVRLHRRKSAIYREIVASGRLPARPGVARLAAEAIASDWLVAVASTSAESSVRAVIDNVFGEALASELSAVLAGDVVPHKKPAPDIYDLALRRLGVGAGDAIAIEDSRNGLRAAVGAAIPCVITLTEYTAGEDMTGAALVLSSLGAAGDPARQIAGTGSRPLEGIIRLQDLDACVARCR